MIYIAIQGIRAFLDLSPRVKAVQIKISWENGFKFRAQSEWRSNGEKKIFDAGYVEES